MSLTVLLAALSLVGSATQSAGQAVVYDKTDVLLVFDTTSSMTRAIEQAKTSATDLTAKLTEQLGDVSFAVARTQDYPGLYGDYGDVPWQTVLTNTQDQGAVAAAISALTVRGGGDDPESYGGALERAITSEDVAWRAGSRRIVVLFADDVPHDDDLNRDVPAATRSVPSPWNTGSDPGLDGVVSTSDDVDWQPLLDKMRMQRTPLVVVQFNKSPARLAYWKYWTSRTGGEAVLAGEGDLASTVTGLAVEAALSLAPDAGVLARAWRPRIYFDSREQYFPIAVDAFFGERTDAGAPAYQVCVKARSVPRRKPNQKCRPITDASDLAVSADALGAGTSGELGIEFDGKRSGSSAGCPEGAWKRDCNGGPSSVIYARTWRAQSGYFLIDYWWYMRYNEGQGIEDHEGDWEGISVWVRPGESGVESVIYTGHGNSSRIRADVLSSIGALDSRPEVYVAQGTHASYPERCNRPLGAGCPDWGVTAVNIVVPLDAGRDGDVEWRGNDDCGDCAVVIDEPSRFPWLAFRGFWGFVGPGPETPGHGANAQRYNEPWVSPVWPPKAVTPTKPTGARPVPRQITALGYLDLPSDLTATNSCGDFTGPFVNVVICSEAESDRAFLEDRSTEPTSLGAIVAGAKTTGRGAGPGLFQSIGEPLSAGDTITFTGAAANDAAVTLLVASPDGVEGSVEHAWTRLPKNKPLRLTEDFVLRYGNKAIRPSGGALRARPPSVLSARWQNGALTIRIRPTSKKTRLTMISPTGRRTNTRPVRLRPGKVSVVTIRVAKRPRWLDAQSISDGLQRRGKVKIRDSGIVRTKVVATTVGPARPPSGVAIPPR